MNDKISVCFTEVFFKSRQIVILNKLGNRLCCGYGYGFERGHKFTNEPLGKMYLTKIPRRISAFVIKKIADLFNYPKYYVYWGCCAIFDRIVAKKVANDESKIVFVKNCPHTIKACKAKGKVVIIEAGNSEPKREYSRITMEYDRFSIKKKYIYGDKKYLQRNIDMLQCADMIISISKVSMQTYLDAGMRADKIKLISLAGCSWKVDMNYRPAGKSKAFITTGFHNFIKGTHRLLLAWKKSEIKNIPLLVVGTLCEDMQEFIAKYGPFDNVQYLGQYPHSKLKDLYGTYSACGALLSLSEGAGRVTPEMMSFGFPMIVSPDATCDLVEDGVNGYIIDPTDEAAIVARLRWFADDWKRVEAMNEAVINSVKSRTMEDYAIEVADYLLSYKV